MLNGFLEPRPFCGFGLRRNRFVCERQPHPLARDLVNLALYGCALVPQV
jgi:hypothetical protein